MLWLRNLSVYMVWLDVYNMGKDKSHPHRGQVSGHGNARSGEMGVGANVGEGTCCNSYNFVIVHEQNVVATRTLTIAVVAMLF